MSERKCLLPVCAPRHWEWIIGTFSCRHAAQERRIEARGLQHCRPRMRYANRRARLNISPQGYKTFYESIYGKTVTI